MTSAKTRAAVVYNKIKLSADIHIIICINIGTMKWTIYYPLRWISLYLYRTGHALGIWIYGCSLLYRRELWASKSAGFNSTKSLKICRCKRWCPKDLQAHASVLTHSLNGERNIYKNILFSADFMIPVKSLIVNSAI